MRLTIKCLIAAAIFVVPLTRTLAVRAHSMRDSTVVGTQDSTATGKFPEDRAALETMIAAQNTVAIRAHAWAMLEFLTGDRENETPAWETWKGKCNLGLGGSCRGSDSSNARLIHLYELPVQLRSTQGSHFESVSAFNISAALYNPDAAGAISKLSLNDPAVWSKYSEDPSAETTLTDAFGTGSIVVKEMWEAVQNCPPHKHQYGCPAMIPVWDPAQHPQDYTGTSLRPAGQWDNSYIAINQDTNLPCDMSKSYKYFPPRSTPPVSEWVPINCFHWIRITPQIDSKAGEIINEQSGWSSSGEAYLVLVGFHVITSELPTWTWSTFWWTLPNVNTGKRDDHPNVIASHIPWSLYSMDTTLSNTKQTAPDGGPQIIFNPYLEGAQNYGPISNCITCHTNAVYRPNSTATYIGPDISEALQPRCFYSRPSKPGCTTTGYIKKDTYWTVGTTQTHFLWSLAIKQDTNNPNPPVNLPFAKRFRSDGKTSSRTTPR